MTTGRNGGALAPGEEFRVTEELPGEVRICRIRVAEDECWGCVAGLLDGDQRAALDVLVAAANAHAALAAQRDALRAALVEERAARKWEATWSNGPCWDRSASGDIRAVYRRYARAELVAEGVLRGEEG